MQRIAVLLSCLVALGNLAAAPFLWSTAVEGQKLTVEVKIAKGYYLYANQLSFNIQDGTGTSPKILSTAPRKSYDDPMSGKVEIIPEGVARWSFSGQPPFSVTVGFQGCRAASPGTPGLCLVPETLQLLPGNTPGKQLAGEAADLGLLEWKVVRRAIGSMNEADFLRFLHAGEGAAAPQEKAPFQGFGIWMVLLLTLLGGLGLNLTPCVLPMIPVNLAIIGAGESKIAGFRRGLSYGSGMALAYGILGVLVILTGARFGQLNASSGFNFSVAFLFIVLAAAMFGLFNLDFSSRININPNRWRGGKTVVALLMGVVAALLAGACVAPVVIGVLLFAAERYNSGYPLALLLPFLLGIGMGLPWPFAGAGLAVLPKPGKFMVAVKYLFGVLIALMAVYYGYTGYTLLPGKYSPEAEIAGLRSAAAESLRTNKPLLVDFWASWCKNCKEMDRSVLSRPEVKKELQNYTFFKFQAEKPSEAAIAELLNRWNIPGFPAFVVLAPKSATAE